MDETKGISNIDGFQSINTSQKELGVDTVASSGSSSEGDALGVRHWPGLFKYMEEHTAFSASILSIIGYIVIASFGSMETLGQYLGYIIFLAIIGFIYNFNKKGGKYLYLLIALLLLMFGILIFQNWSTVSSYYKKINQPFQIDTKVDNIVPTQTSP